MIGEVLQKGTLDTDQRIHSHAANKDGQAFQEGLLRSRCFVYITLEQDMEALPQCPNTDQEPPRLWDVPVDHLTGALRSDRLI